MDLLVWAVIALAFFGCASTIQHYKKERDYWREQAGYGEPYPPLDPYPPELP